MSDLLESMKADALEAQRFSRKHMVLELDFSEFSIGELEWQVDSVDYAIPGGRSPDNLEMLTRIWGAYLGEAVRKAVGGDWVQQEDGQIALQKGTQTIFPHVRLRARLEEGAPHNLVEYFKSSVSDLG